MASQCTSPFIALLHDMLIYLQAVYLHRLVVSISSSPHCIVQQADVIRPFISMQVRAAQSSRRSSITKDVRGQVTKALQPASPSSVLGPSRPQGKAYLGLLQRQKAAERGTVALRRARQQRQVEDLSRKLCKAQQANVPARQQADAVMTTPLKGSQVPCSLKCRHGAATFIRRQQSAAGSSLNRAAQIKGVAKGAMAPQQALLEVIAQTQWKLHNVEPQLHKYLTDSKIHHQRCTKLELHVDTPVQLESTKACVKSATLSNSGGSAAMQEDSLVPGRTGFSAPAQSKASGPKQEPPTAVYPVKQSDSATSVQSRFLKGHDVSIKLSSNPYFMFSTVEHTPEQLRASAPDIFSDNISHPVQDRLRCPMTFTKISSSDKLQLKQRSAPKLTDMVMDSSSPTMHKSHDAMGSEGSDEAFGLCPSGHYHSPGSHFRPALSPGDTEVVSSFAETPSHEGRRRPSTNLVRPNACLSESSKHATTLRKSWNFFLGLKAR